MNAKTSDFWLKFSALFLLLSIAGTIYSVRPAMDSLSFISAALIANLIVLALHIYYVKKPSQTLQVAVIVFLVGGINVIKTWLPIADSNWKFSLFYYSLGFLMISAWNVFTHYFSKHEIRD